MTSSQTSKADILIVDDTLDNLRLLATMLTNQGYGVRKALSGPMAIASAQSEPPDLILLDIKMPEMNGYEVCQRLKTDIRTQAIPIIFISALDEIIDKVQAFSFGGADYITKPFQLLEVLARIENQLNLQRLQQQLIEQNQKLASINQELEQFTSIVSHDLQQPIQSITGFAKLLLLKCQSQLDDSDLKYINSIVDAGSRMQQLVQDLLTYAQSDNQYEGYAPVDCNVVITKVLDNLQAAIAKQQVKVIYASLPTVTGNEVQLIQLFQNLLSNAIKFSRPDVQPRVEISATRQNDDWRFSIRDNGIGIPFEHKEKIFEAFQRLHSAKEYPGNGIGLATCKKIVESHNGYIGFESKVNFGTTFYFTLPIQPDANTSDTNVY